MAPMCNCRGGPHCCLRVPVLPFVIHERWPCHEEIIHFPYDYQQAVADDDGMRQRIRQEGEQNGDSRTYTERDRSDSQGS